ncbi:MAG TPA: hypothetical protein GX507_01885 [Clostridia bacterium]|nr:hypothetical protein [Clostridia bacterium]
MAVASHMQNVRRVLTAAFGLGKNGDSRKAGKWNPSVNRQGKLRRLDLPLAFYTEILP